MTIVKQDVGYSAHASVGNKFIATQGDDLAALKKNIADAVGITFPGSRLDILYRFDLESFFDFYKVINVKALSQRIGMNQSLLSQYINGSRIPSQNQIKRILTGVHEIGKELVEAEFVV
jgi:transcriptional regulator with XRE-family HTH domain